MNNLFKIGSGIPHIESLQNEDFINVVKNINSFSITEKLDGSNFLFGIDKDNRFFTSRESKGGFRCFNISDYDDNKPANSGFIAAHCALSQITNELKSVLSPGGDMVECELLFRKQPNTVIYGDNQIVFLRMVPVPNSSSIPDQSITSKLSKLLKDKKVNSTTKVVTSKTGDTIEIINETHEWKFNAVQPISINIDSSILNYHIDQFENLCTKQKDNFKTKKEFQKAITEQSDIIKRILLQLIVQPFVSPFRTCKLNDTDYSGIEGIIIFQQSTGFQCKLVDKLTFTTINQFYYTIRNLIKRTSYGNLQKSEIYERINIPVNVPYFKISIYDDMLSKIAKLIDIPSVSSYLQTTRAIKKFGSVDAFLKEWKDIPFKELKQKIINIMVYTIHKLEEFLTYFKISWETYSITLKSGIVVKYTPNIYDRTLLTFAETKRDLLNMLYMLHRTANIDELSLVIYKKHFQSAF